MTHGISRGAALGMALGVLAFGVAPVAEAAGRLRGAAPVSARHAGGGGAVGARAGNISGQTRNSQFISGQTRNTGNRNNGNRINTGDVNIGNRTNINIDGDHDHGWDWDDDYHPIARGVAFGAAAAVTAAAIGSMVYALPPACAPYPYSGFTYYSCGGVYYEPRYQGDTITYVVVNAPG